MCRMGGHRAGHWIYISQRQSLGIILGILEIFTQVCGYQEDTSVPIPPVIVEGPPQHVIFPAGKTVSLPCVATGDPKPRCLWFKNGDRLHESSSPVQLPKYTIGSDCNLIIGTSHRSTQGYYQCKVSNGAASSFSNITFLEEAVLRIQHGGHRIQEQNVSIIEGNPVTLHCDPTYRIHSVPTAGYLWSLIPCRGCDHLRHRVQLGKRINMLPNGDLVFSHTTLEDIQSSHLYACEMHNPIIGKTLPASYFRILVHPNSYDHKRVPGILYASESPKVALIGGSVSLQCLFAGRPAPMVKWHKDGGPLPGNRFSLRHSGQELFIRKVHYRDGGYYECTGHNEAGDSRMIRMLLRIEGKAIVRKAPRSRNVTVGTQVALPCKTSGVPTPTVSWFINDVPLEVSGHSWWIAKDNTKLVLYNLYAKDSMTVHCNASNKHGYEIKSAYIRIVDEDSIDNVLTYDESEEETSSERPRHKKKKKTREKDTDLKDYSSEVERDKVLEDSMLQGVWEIVSGLKVHFDNKIDRLSDEIKTLKDVIMYRSKQNVSLSGQ